MVSIVINVGISGILNSLISLKENVVLQVLNMIMEIVFKQMTETMTQIVQNTIFMTIAQIVKQDIIYIKISAVLIITSKTLLMIVNKVLEIMLTVLLLWVLKETNAQLVMSGIIYITDFAFLKIQALMKAMKK